MLGENHSIHHEFPDFHDRIDALSKTDPDFLSRVHEHDKLDKQIRGLEMRESPRSDQEMERLKQNRLHLKDLIYQRLTQGS